MNATAPTPAGRPGPARAATRARRDPTVLRERRGRRRRAALWGALVALLLVAQTLLVALTLNYETSRAQELTDNVAVEVAAEVRRRLAVLQQQLLAIGLPSSEAGAVGPVARGLLAEQRELMRIEWRDADGRMREAMESPYRPPVFALFGREGNELETLAACAAARRSLAPVFSRSYFVPLDGGLGLELMDVCLPLIGDGGAGGFLVATLGLAPLLEAAMGPGQSRSHELTFNEGDGTRLARAGVPRGAGVFVAERLVDLPGTTLQLRADNAAGAPRLIPNLSTALVLGLSLALLALVLVLARDVRRRARAEGALAEALSLRKAMDDALVTGLRARTLDGRISYVNPAFCAMVGYSAAELLDATEPPYWPPEHRDEYKARLAARQRAGGEALNAAAREGLETQFMRKDGERFPVMVYETPLADALGRQTGWMSAVLDLSAQRRVEDLSRQQQERLQATARLATVGEMASLMSHELNQPLSAIASYASGSLNLLDAAAPPGPPALPAGSPAHASTGPAPAAPGAPATAAAADAADAAEEMRALLRQALVRIAEQAERAGRVIKSVHDFVRRREQQHEAIGADVLLDAVLPLVRLQSRKSATRIELDLPAPAPRVLCDRTMVEQVLLNLTRNGIQAMDPATPPAARVLTLRVRQTHPRWVLFTVQDAGPGIPPDVAPKLFTPFYTTRREGMGLGLSLCRTVVEQHGGVLDFEPVPGGGTAFRFTLPAAPARAVAAAAPTDAAVPAPAPSGAAPATVPPERPTAEAGPA